MQLSAMHFGKLAQQLPAIKIGLTGLLLLLVAYQLGQASYTLLFTRTISPSPLAVAHPGSGERWAWFTPQAAPEPVARIADIQESRLNAKLLGIIRRTNGSVAVIDTGRQKESKVFREGDSISRTAILHKIETDRVLIRENGTIRSLTLATQNTKGITAQTSYNSRKLPTPAQLGLTSTAFAGITFVETQSGETGLSLGTINQAMLQGTPLQRGDVVTRADGASVQEIMDNPNNYQQLLGRDSLDLLIMRDGEEVIVNINPRAIAPNVMRAMER